MSIGRHDFRAVALSATVAALASGSVTAQTVGNLHFELTTGCDAQGANCTVETYDIETFGVRADENGNVIVSVKQAGSPAVGEPLDSPQLGVLDFDGQTYSLDLFEVEVLSNAGQTTLTFTASEAAPPTYTVTASVPNGGGAVSPTSAEVAEGAYTDFTLSAANGYQIDTSATTGCGGSFVTSSVYRTGTISQDCAVTAAFSELPTIGNCGTLPGNVDLKPYDIYQNNQTTENLSTQIRSFEFTTNANTVNFGALVTAYTALNPVVRTVWISTCPGDTSNIEALGARCADSGYEIAEVQWTQGPDAMFRCVLEPNKTYYFNVKNALETNLNGSTCSVSNCPFYLQRNYGG